MAHFYTVKAFLPDMVARNSGHIVTIASIAGNIAGCSMTDYHASKFANVGFDLALRAELAQASLDGIHTTIVKPFFINTGMFSGTRSDLIPFLEPQYVVDRVVCGILASTKEIILPYGLVFAIQLLHILPSKCIVYLFDFLGGFESMSQFHGRTPEVNNNNNATNNGKKIK